jgi:hypothetical protein
MTSIVKQDIANLIDGWLDAESKGVQFPVPFDLAWQIAGYSRKDSAKRKLPKSSQGKVYHISVENPSIEGGRPREVITLSCDGLKHLCLMAETEQGDQIRQYFIEAEKNWRLVQERYPSIAHEMELIKLRNEGLALEAQKEMAIAQAKQADLALAQFRNTIVNTCPEPVQQKILGFSVIEKIEYRDRIIKDDEIINDGETVTKTYLCDRYGFKTKSGKPDYKSLNNFLTQTGLESISEAWQLSAYVQESQQLKREYLGELDRRFHAIKSRQLFLGE